MLIDGDNAQPSLIEHILATTEKHGTVTVRRVYGDWTSANLSGWKDLLPSYALQPMQQFSYAVGKNATDIALIIEAMDLLHGGTVGGFCIVSSDSDYTRLAMRIREQGLFVMGVGRSNTPKSFVNACHVFISIENLPHQTEEDNINPGTTLPKQNKIATQSTKKASSSDWTVIVGRAVKAARASDGWADMAAVGSNLPSSFESSKYGHAKLSRLIETRPALFETRRESTTIKVRIKP